MRNFNNGERLRKVSYSPSVHLQSVTFEFSFGTNPFNVSPHVSVALPADERAWGRNILPGAPAKACQKKEIHRCLKRYIIRELYPIILVGRQNCTPTT
uniref:hypothetical protein n=1 Tax=Polaromonas glacialis TaxID=866564 RepID=UPI0012EB9306|nr:hypothetical protein [Polaromonas glacialis]